MGIVAKTGTCLYSHAPAACGQIIILPAIALNCGTHTTHVAYRDHLSISLTKRTEELNGTVIRRYRQ